MANSSRLTYLITLFFSVLFVLTNAQANDEFGGFHDGYFEHLSVEINQDLKYYNQLPATAIPTAIKNKINALLNKIDILIEHCVNYPASPYAQRAALALEYVARSFLVLSASYWSPLIIPSDNQNIYYAQLVKSVMERYTTLEKIASQSPMENNQAQSITLKYYERLAYNLLTVENESFYRTGLPLKKRLQHFIKLNGFDFLYVVAGSSIFGSGHPIYGSMLISWGIISNLLTRHEVDTILKPYQVRKKFFKDTRSACLVYLSLRTDDDTRN